MEDCPMSLEKLREGMILGELKEFKRATMERLDDIEKKVDRLDRFKIKVTVVMVAVLGTIELGFRVYETMK
jgi:tetrahydromethanopterin S-methyltransferase subunit G